MRLFCASEEFKELIIAVSLDEGLAREDDGMTVFYGERHVFFCAVRILSFFKFKFGTDLTPILI